MCDWIHAGQHRWGWPCLLLLQSQEKWWSQPTPLYQCQISESVRVTTHAGSQQDQTVVFEPERLHGNPPVEQRDVEVQQDGIQHLRLHEAGRVRNCDNKEISFAT